MPCFSRPCLRKPCTSFWCKITINAISQSFIDGFGWNFDTRCKILGGTLYIGRKNTNFPLFPNVLGSFSLRNPCVFTHGELSGPRTSIKHQKCQKSHYMKNLEGLLGKLPVKYQPDPSINGWDMAILVNAVLLLRSSNSCVIVTHCSTSLLCGSAEIST
jgi:hypothetical protein